MTEKDKKSRIDSRKATREKRESQACSVFDIKILSNKLNKTQKETLKMFFIEKKWLYNYILSTDSIFTYDYKNLKTTNLDKDKNLVEHELAYLPAKVRQDIVYGIKKSVFALSASKKAGNHVGRLRFRSECNSIDLSQFGNTHAVVNNNKIRIQGVRGKLYARGLSQVSKDFEPASAKLMKRPDGYHLMLACYRSKETVENERKEHIKLHHHNNQKDGGIDLNIKNTVVTSEGKTYSCRVEESERLKNLQRKLSKQTKRSNNWHKTRLKLQRSHQRTTSKKQDQGNKIIHDLRHDFDVLYMQDENLKGWQQGWFGKQVQQSCLGMIKIKLTTSKISRWLPTTKFCYCCGCINKIGLRDRIFSCKQCHYTEDRDIKSAKTILFFGRFQYDTDQFNTVYGKLSFQIPPGRRDFKPAEIKTSVGSLADPASFICETGRYGSSELC